MSPSWCFIYIFFFQNPFRYPYLFLKGFLKEVVTSKKILSPVIPTLSSSSTLSLASFVLHCQHQKFLSLSIIVVNRFDDKLKEHLLGRSSTSDISSDQPQLKVNLSWKNTYLVVLPVMFDHVVGGKIQNDRDKREQLRRLTALGKKCKKSRKIKICL